MGCLKTLGVNGIKANRDRRTDRYADGMPLVILSAAFYAFFYIFLQTSNELMIINIQRYLSIFGNIVVARMQHTEYPKKNRNSTIVTLLPFFVINEVAVKITRKCYAKSI